MFIEESKPSTNSALETLNNERLLSSTICTAEAIWAYIFLCIRYDNRARLFNYSLFVLNSGFSRIVRTFTQRRLAFYRTKLTNGYRVARDADSPYNSPLRTRTTGVFRRNRIWGRQEGRGGGFERPTIEKNGSKNEIFTY